MNTDKQKEGWVKVTERLPSTEGAYKVKKAYSEETEVAYFDGKNFPNYDGYKVVEWQEKDTPQLQKPKETDYRTHAEYEMAINDYINITNPHLSKPQPQELPKQLCPHLEKDNTCKNSCLTLCVEGYKFWNEELPKQGERIDVAELDKSLNTIARLQKAFCPDYVKANNSGVELEMGKIYKVKKWYNLPDDNIVSPGDLCCDIGNGSGYHNSNFTSSTEEEFNNQQFGKQGEEVNEDAIGEKILCAAIWYQEQPTAKILPTNIDKGIVVAGHRHGHCIHTFVALTGKRSVLPECGEYTQGFITSTGRFVNRLVAYKIAYNQNQIIGPNKGCPENAIGLTSEDLY